jgi:MYXO-CTERM domain-containing protein
MVVRSRLGRLYRWQLTGHPCQGIPGEFFNDFSCAGAPAQGSVNPDWALAMFGLLLARMRSTIHRISELVSNGRSNTVMISRARAGM